MDALDLIEAELIEEDQPEQNQETPLQRMIEFEELDTFNDLDVELKLIQKIEEIQDFEKMYQFVNKEYSMEQLNQYADKCLQYITSDKREYNKVQNRVDELKSKPIIIQDDDLDFI